LASNSKIKPTAITRAGYEYQDLVGIEVLIRHFRDPELFQWVQLESDDENAKHLDDVVALRRDGRTEYYQVKFTVDAEVYEFDWEWLLAKKPKGTSLLAKWCSGYLRARSHGPIHRAEVRTNRRPSSTLATCMAGDKVDFGKIPDEIRPIVVAECGSENDAKEFFASFEFKASELDFDHFERSLRDNLVPTDTDTSGWLLLGSHVRRWAIFKGEPKPDGRIYREHIVQLVTKKRPQPISQEFRVPPGYEPPSVAFHSAFTDRVSGSSSVSILWGTPGRGKSTYLSFLKQELEDAGNAVIRHHYFLSNESSTEHRTSFVDVSTSLTDQLLARYLDISKGITGNSDNLRSDLEIVAGNLARQDKRLFLIIDGLDHVYRDTARIDQLNHLFNALFPLPQNVSLIVGTQRVPDAQLPAKLILAAEEGDWIEIPPMDQIRVHRWIAAQDADRPLILKWPADADRRPSEIAKISTAFYSISQGHPLHLIYAFESLIRSGSPITEDDVVALPPCPDGDIRTYYRGLWRTLDSNAQTTLHMLSGSEFLWPSLGVRQCVGDFAQIEFLLEPRDSGLAPFHGSIFAWVKERSDHGERYTAILPSVIAWLENDAPMYWRWGWLWLMKAQAGDFTDLVAKTTREWAVTSLAEGWPEGQIVRILAAAEKHTFQEGDLPATVVLRSLKTRVANARDYQSRDYGRFLGVALAAHQNEQQALNLADNLSGLKAEEIVGIVKYGPRSCFQALRRAGLNELASRVNAWVELRHRPAHEFSALSDQLLMIAAVSGEDHVSRVMRYLNGFDQPAKHFHLYIRLLGEAQDLESLQRVARYLRGRAWITERRTIQKLITRTALLRGADLRPLVSDEEPLNPMTACWYVLRHGDKTLSVSIPEIATDIVRDRYSYGENHDLTAFFYDAFWATLYHRLIAEGDFSSVYPGLPNERGWLQTGLECLEAAAAAIAFEALPAKFSSVYLAAADVAPVPFRGHLGEDAYSQYMGFRRALLRIATDLHLVGGNHLDSDGVGSDDLAIARASIHWVDEIWLSENADSMIPLLDKEAAAQFVDSIAEELGTSISEFGERAEKWTNLATLSLLYGVGPTKALITRAADCLAAYGYRKDLGAMDTLDAIETMHSADGSKTEQWVKLLIPIVEEITEFTDGDETDHIRIQLIDLISKTLPQLIPRFYARHISRDEWRYADAALEAHLRTLDLRLPEAAGLTQTLPDAQMLGVLDDRSDEPVARALLDAQRVFLGQALRETERFRSSPEPLRPEQEELIKVSPTSFGATDFGALAAHVGAAQFPYQRRKAYLREWLDHWSSKRKAPAALKSIRTYFQSGKSTHDVEEILDAAFDISLVVEGKAAAYPWLVDACIFRHGWQTHHAGEDEVMARLKKAATHYSDRWLRFIHDSSQAPPYWHRRGRSFAIGYQYLVRFLVLVEQTEIASKVTDGFVTSLIGETRDQPIPEEVAWLK
jgi:hypothetical protein